MLSQQYLIDGQQCCEYIVELEPTPYTPPIVLHFHMLNDALDTYRSKVQDNLIKREYHQINLCAVGDGTRPDGMPVSVNFLLLRYMFP